MSTIPFFVRPLEWVSFGLPKSMVKGEAHHRRTQFPPTPTTFQGIVRSHLLRAAEPELDLAGRGGKAVAERAALVGGADELPSGWKLRGPFPTIIERQSDREVASPWVPTPRLLLKQGEEHLHLRRLPEGRGRNDLDPESAPVLLGRPDAGKTEPLGGFIGPGNLLHVLYGEGSCQQGWDKSEHGHPRPPFVHIEHRPGVEIGEDGTAEDSMLYVLDALRFGGDDPRCEAGLLGWLEATLPRRIPERALHEGTSATGKGGRLLEFKEPLPLHPAWQKIERGEHLPRQVQADESFYLIALTPAALAPNAALCQPFLPAGVTLRIEAAMTGRREVIGGFDMAGGRYRSNRSYLPAGSCWLFSLSGGSAEQRAQALRGLHNELVLGLPADRSFGYGHTLVARGPRAADF